MNESIISTGTPSGKISLNDEERNALVSLGSLRWDETKIAAYFGWPRNLLHAELENPESEVSKLLLKGELEAQFKLEFRLMTDAQGGNLSAAHQWRELMRDRSFKISKLDIFGGSEDPDIFKSIQKYIQAGSSKDMSVREQLYLDALQMIYSLSVKFGDRKTLRLLAKEPYCLPYHRAKDLIAEATELFNGGRRTSKIAMRHQIAESYDTLYHAILDRARTNQDYALAASVLEKKVKILELDKPDPVILPPEQYRKTFRLTTLTPEALGLPPANRDELGAQIDAMEGIDEHDRRRLLMEAGVIDTDIIEILKNGTEKEA